MTKRCSITAKSILSGNNVSHSKAKTKRRFLPNLRNITVRSDILNKDFNIKISMNALRTIEKHNGFDNYLLTTKSKNLTEESLKIKHQIKRKLALQSV